MKKTKILTFALAIGVSGLFAQGMKPVSGEMGVTVGLTSGFSGTITTGGSNTGTALFRYMLADDMAARVGLNFGSLGGNGVVVSDSTVALGGDGLSQTTTTTSGSLWALSLGAQKSMGGNDKLDPYFGADLFVGGVAGQKVDANQEYLKAGGGNLVGDYSQTIAVGMNTMTWGVQGIAGFNYFFADHFAIGAEIGYGYTSSTSKGGEFTTETKANTTVTKTSATASDNAMTKSSAIGITGGTINLSWFFGM